MCIEGRPIGRRRFRTFSVSRYSRILARPDGAGVDLGESTGRIRAAGPAAAARCGGRGPAAGIRPQRGRRASQVARPWAIRRWLKSIQCLPRQQERVQLLLDRLGLGPGGQAEAERQPLDVGVDDHARGDRDRRRPSTTLAVLRPTPGRLVRASRSAGDLAAVPLDQDPGERDEVASPWPGRSRWRRSGPRPPPGRPRRARPGESGKRAKRAGVTLFTRSSVHWAERTVATSSPKASR